MSERSFYEDRAKQRAKEAVESVEAQTSAEIVVCLRGASDSYRDADYLFGFALSVVALVAMLFGGKPLPLVALPLGVVASFLFGAVLSANLTPIRRLVVLPERKAGAVRLAARGAFVDQGVSRTQGRTGVLVYVSMFERRVEVLPDVGVLAARLGPAWGAAVSALERSLSPSPDVERFLAAMKGLGPVLAERLPRLPAEAADAEDAEDAGPSG
jgi:putative membrane protein